jgi:hypothetical protein
VLPVSILKQEGTFKKANERSIYIRLQPDNVADKSEQYAKKDEKAVIL